MNTFLNLIISKRFLPLFLTQFLGAFNDNLFKNALIILILFEISQSQGASIIALSGGLFILPFFLFSAFAGELADRIEKSSLIKKIKFSEIIIMIGGAVALLTQSLPGLLFILFLMGTQSAFFGPVKYSILPQHVEKESLVEANGLVEAGTFMAILLGTIGGALLIGLTDTTAYAAVSVIIIAVFGLIASFFIPKTEKLVFDSKLKFRPWAQTKEVMSYSRENKRIHRSILAISWFWLVGAVYLSQVPALGKEILNGSESVVTLLLVLFTVGISIGSIGCHWLMKGSVTTKFVPIAAAGIALFGFDLYFALSAGPIPGGEISGMFSSFNHIRLMFDIFALAVSGGLFIVPLYTVLQNESDVKHRARVIGSNNIWNAIFGVVGSLLTAVILYLGGSVETVLLTISLLGMIFAVLAIIMVPTVLIKAGLQIIFKTLYRVDVKGLENLPKKSERALIIANHQSFLDAALIAAFLPGRPAFAINSFIAQRWWVKPFLTLVDAISIDPTNPMATKTLIKAVESGREVCIFPEGRLTVTGSLMKVYEGPGLVADKANALLVPVRIEGADQTPFSRLKGKIKQHWFPKISLTVLPSEKISVSDEIVGRSRRELIGRQLQDIMSQSAFITRPSRSLFESVLDARNRFGGDVALIEDIQRKPMSYDRLIAGSFALGRVLNKKMKKDKNIGVLLPNSNACVVSFFALQAYGKVPAMLNPTMSKEALQASLKASECGFVLTSRTFIEKGQLEEVISIIEEVSNIIYLEDIAKSINIFSKIYAGFKSKFSGYFIPDVSENDPGVILFTSGSEGLPKGVVLSHDNILANCRQLSSRIDFTPADTVFNALPMFHSFGLTGGTLLPVLGGVKVFLYPSPLHYRVIPEMIYDRNATILFGTDTFLNGYAKSADPYDFYAVRYVFAGAERVKESTRNLFSEKFGLRIFEGYGCTETAPVISVNTPMFYKTGTVGRILPGIETKLEPVPGVEADGRLYVKGANIMKGYLKPENPGVIEEPVEGWHDTGDIVDIDERGFISIKGRAKRFAKIGGEMVSLGSIEDLAEKVWPNDVSASISIPDERKGEKIILVTACQTASLDDFRQFAKKNGVPEISVPSKIEIIDEIPLLGTGKPDYMTLQKKFIK